MYTVIGNLGAIKSITTPKYLEKQRFKKDGGKGETLSFATIKMHQRIFERAINYYKNGVFDKF